MPNTIEYMRVWRAANKWRNKGYKDVFNLKHPGRSTELHKQWRDLNPGKAAASSEARRMAHPERVNASARILNRVRRKTLTRGCCVFCGKLNAHAHHEDYSKPLEIVWVCRKHHADIHAGKLHVKPEQIISVPRYTNRKQ